MHFKVGKRTRTPSNLDLVQWCAVSSGNAAGLHAWSDATTGCGKKYDMHNVASECHAKTHTPDPETEARPDLIRSPNYSQMRKMLFGEQLQSRDEITSRAAKGPLSSVSASVSVTSLC